MEALRQRTSTVPDPDDVESLPDLRAELRQLPGGPIAPPEPWRLDRGGTHLPQSWFGHALDRGQLLPGTGGHRSRSSWSRRQTPVGPSNRPDADVEGVLADDDPRVEGATVDGEAPEDARMLPEADDG